jgi:hypothetical protein
VSGLGPALVGLVFGLAVVGAVLLRNEDEVREAWQQRRGGGAPKANPAGRWSVVFLGLLASVNIGLGVASGDIFYIILGTLWLLMFCLSLLRYRRSQGST